MSKRECANLVFYITDTETNQTLIIGEGGGIYSEIQKSEDMFGALKTFQADAEDTRTIPIPIYLNSMNDTLYLNTFFNPKKKYDLKILMNNTNYYTKCKVEDPDVSNCDDLYGDSSKLIVYTINLALLENRNYFTTDYIASKNVGAGLKANFRWGKTYAFTLDLTGYYFSIRQQLQPVNVMNSGGESNGFLLTITPSSPLLNPKITNLTTGFSMTINISAKVGDKLIIDTENKTVSLNGKYYQNVKRILDDWLVLEQGLNTVKFSADSGAEDATVELQYRNKLRGL